MAMRNLTQTLIVAAAVVNLLTIAALGIANSRNANTKADRLAAAFEARYGDWSQHGHPETFSGAGNLVPVF
jgi:hypothetical protein